MARKKTKEEWKVYGNVFDEFTLRILHKLEAAGHFSEMHSSYRLGKEANIFLARHPEKDIIVKIYRLENCNFNKMYQYLMQDERYENLKGQRRKIIFAWVQREYRNLLKAREVIRVPTPITFKDNVLLLETIGENDAPSPELKDAQPKDVEGFFEQVITMIRKLKEHGLVHGDLSGFNILNHYEEPVFIDFSQATTTKSLGWEELLKRDITNVCSAFRKHGLDKDPENIYQELLQESKETK